MRTELMFHLSIRIWSPTNDQWSNWWEGGKCPTCQLRCGPLFRNGPPL